ncbi:FIG00554312: hypothetical protein [Cronobacter dublinensis 1210]|uniref:Uncharacterized protein n=1 Tax=Cronobacter dublinensis 1210 TaxID=1208656 RepID=A0ABM9QD72_9ENTR|nr:FIG00554312: hypothetical protein [Cronobacter dublinensis 1210]
MTYLWEPDERYTAEAERLAQRAQAQESQAIAVRRLLAQLPRELRMATHVPGTQAWQATLEGGGPLLHDALARRLSDFPFPLVTPAPPRPLPTPRRFTLPAAGPDSAPAAVCAAAIFAAHGRRRAPRAVFSAYARGPEHRLRGAVPVARLRWLRRAAGAVTVAAPYARCAVT